MHATEEKSLQRQSQAVSLHTVPSHTVPSHTSPAPVPQSMTMQGSASSQTQLAQHLVSALKGASDKDAEGEYER